MRRDSNRKRAGLMVRVLPSIVATLAVVALIFFWSAPGGAGSAPLVVIDPGHDLYANSAVEPIGPGSSTMKIKDGGGTRGVVSGNSEAVVNLAVSKRLAALLRKAGIRVVMTRTSTSHVSMGNVARAQIANRLHAAAFVRIHCDGGAASTAGTHTLYPAYRRGWTDDIYAQSKRLARLVQAELVRSLRFPDRGLDARSDITGFNWADVPVILPELGFLTNPGEDRVLSSRSGQKKAAVGMCRGILRFLGRSPVRCG
jgi:N-acetylmuramoyl-L-alanine amidase